MSLGGGSGSLQRHLQVPLDERLDVASYQRRFRVSFNVRDVAVKLTDSPEDIASDRINTLFRGFRDMKKLKTVSFESRDEKTPGSTPIQTLTLAVTHARNIKDLFIGNVTVRGSSADLAALSTVLRRRQSLEEFALVGCQFPEVTRAPLLDPLLRSMVDLPQIRVVHIQARALNSLGTLTSNAVSALCHSKTLKELKLHPFDLTDDQFMTASRSLETNKALEELSLGICNFTVVTMAALAKMLRRNSILSWLELKPKERIKDKLLIQIAEALEENTSLKHFALHGDFGPISQVTKDAFERMLEENYTLESFQIYGSSESIPEFQMYLRLNKVGRNHLLDPKSRVSRNDWLNAIHRVKDSLDCIFYCLSVNPFLCHTTKDLHSEVRIARRGNKRRRLNDDPDKMTSENSSSVNSSLSSSENSSSPAQSEERRTSTTDSDNHAQNAGGGHQVTSTSESSNNNAKGSEEAASNRPTTTSTSDPSGTDSNEENNPRAAPPHQQQQQTTPTPQALFEALFTSLMGLGQTQTQAQAQTPNAAGLPANGAELLAAGLQAVAALTQQQQQQQQQQNQAPANQQQQQQQQQPQQTSTNQQQQMPTQQQQTLALPHQQQQLLTYQQQTLAPTHQQQQPDHQSQLGAAQRQQLQHQSQATPSVQQQAQEQLQQLQGLLQQQQQPFQVVSQQQPPVQQQQQQFQLPQQQQPQQPQQQEQQPQQQMAADPTNSMFSLAFPLMLSSLLQPGQNPQAQQQNSIEQQLQQMFAAANVFPGAGQGQPQQQVNAHSQPMPQLHPQLMGQVGRQQMQDPSQGPAQASVQAPARAALPEAEITGSDRNAYPLYMPRDKDCLSSYQCFLRQQIELFEAGNEDVKSTMPGRNRPIKLGQVGLRCRHCAMLPARYRGTGATYYPAKLDRLYQAAQNMAQTHFTKHCRHIPPDIINQLSVLLQGSKSSAGAGKKYWSDGAAMLGVYEDDEILRMDRSRATV